MADNISEELLGAVQSRDEIISFIEAFARVNVDVIRSQLLMPVQDAAKAERLIHPDWDDEGLLSESGIAHDSLDEAARNGTKYLHIDVALDARGRDVSSMFLSFTGLSDKLRKSLFPILSLQARTDRIGLSAELKRLNAWLDWVRRDSFDPALFVTYQTGIKTHGQTQNLTGAIGATGAAIAFVDAINQLDPAAIIDMSGPMPPPGVRSPTEIYAWRQNMKDPTLKAVLLRNGRALVFASSKDANIFQSLSTPFTSAKEALKAYNLVRKDAAARKQSLHEFAVGEVKTATDPANLHERMGLASRETQTELRTDRFLMMGLLNREIIEGGEQGRTLNNKDVKRFSHVFNLHHCWDWDGGRTRHPAHWQYFVSTVCEWCGL